MEKYLEINSKQIQLMRPLTKANYIEKTVLTNSAWEYVQLWLRRQRGEYGTRALFYWEQAYSFYLASKDLPFASRPLTAYYCCMNATKALLQLNGVYLENIAHGVSSDRSMNIATNSLARTTVIFNGSGVLCELSKHLGETCNKESHTIYDLLYNLPCIHRAFSITYQCAELFIPISQLKFVQNCDTHKAWLQFRVDDRYANGNSLRYIPSSYERTGHENTNDYLMRSRKRFEWDIHLDKSVRLKRLSQYHAKIRKDMHYISGDERLWYIKKIIPTNAHIITRNSLTLIFAVMHWLSELVRYNPESFNSLMQTKQNWLIHEFIDIALDQFINELSCEITGADIMTPAKRR